MSKIMMQSMNFTIVTATFKSLIDFYFVPSSKGFPFPGSRRMFQID